MIGGPKRRAQGMNTGDENQIQTTPMPNYNTTMSQQRKPAGGQQNQMLPSSMPPPQFPGPFRPLPAVNPTQLTTPMNTDPIHGPDIGQLIQTLRALLGHGQTT